MSSYQFLLLAVLAAGPAPSQQVPATECREWQQCRELATEAAARQDFEGFHDLAWRAVQRGPKNDPALMSLLARAQTLSGRPADALVMLSRLVDLGAPTDADTNDDFRRVRALPGWAALETKITAARAGAVAPPAPPAVVTPAIPAPVKAPLPPAEPPPKKMAAAPKSGRAAPARPPAAEVPPASAPPSTEAPSPAAAPAGSLEAGSEVLRFAGTGALPIAMAYDAVSRRFIVADPHARKLAVVDEFSQHVATLSGAQAGLADVAALEIDTREGNLWVISSDSIGAVPATTLHKFQLISGRVLSVFPLAEALAPGRFVDVAVAPDSTVLALDTTGARVFRLRPDARVLEVAATLTAAGAASIAPAGANVAYVAHADGIARVDLLSGAASAVKSPAATSLVRIARLRWYRGGLVGIQSTPDGPRAIRLELDRAGRQVTRLRVLSADTVAEPTAAVVAADTLYYLAAVEGEQVIVKRLRLAR